jgi:hypothetical protein
MVLTKQDLQDWNSHPVTKMIFAGIKDSLVELKAESCMCRAADETAMKTAFNEGVAEGISSLSEAYEILEEDSE